ncbi:hypothetical protein BCV69DRAFT_107042 [Microstroma glucosiphilum]|uniref:Transcription factor domain-containing protein n=1 Tax=Pseudomicrostroma glucosiphilum TaxID=1684307 RepID=A0A316UCV2_9BASI|nr:hypothetical protein BCV69DRAFT_107042 [Pseudomicrostroma glucosiphilum]PWN23067.1 hypothetical protein BCV69DRAFT_107042 [Pseudomicrostroma glucosiphilum]
MLPVLLQDIIEGSIEQCRGSTLQATPTMYYALSLARDTTTAMYGDLGVAAGDVKPETNLESDDDATWRALVQRWLDWHPLSCLLSPLHRSQLFTTRPSLQSTPSQIVVLAFLVKEESSGVDPLYSENVFSQTQIDQSTSVLPAATNAALLAWNHICHGRTRKGTVYLSLACQLAQSPDALKQSAAFAGEGKLLHSLCQSITVWIYLQIRTKDPMTWRLVADHLPTSYDSAVIDIGEGKAATRKQLRAVERAAMVALSLATGQKRDDERPVEDVSLRAVVTCLEAIQSMAVYRVRSEQQDNLHLLSCCNAISPLMAALGTATRPPGLEEHRLRSRLAYAPQQTSSSGDLPLLCTTAWLHLDFASQLLAATNPEAADADALKSMTELLLSAAQSKVLQSSGAPQLQTILARLAHCQTRCAAALDISPGPVSQLPSDYSDPSYSRVGSHEPWTPTDFSSNVVSSEHTPQILTPQTGKGIECSQGMQLPYNIQATSEDFDLPLSFWGPLPELNAFLYPPP